MASQEELQEYLVGKTGYLKNSDNNSKVIMLSGKWGSGKTHFWQNLIATDGLKKELKDKREVYSYVSLYGKTSIEEIENDIFSQAYYSAIGGENFVTKGFSTFTKRMKRFGNSKIANGLKEEQKDNIERTALSRLNNGGIICFDDFERKSKDIDLNDLFGFITQLTLNFKCKVIIILNDDVFKGEEKNIFSNVKEKSVSKYLFYNPTIKELFDSIFSNDEKYRKLDDYRDIILSTIDETEELNARIYTQVLDNVLEFFDNTNDEYKGKNEVLRCLILININFILYHKLCIIEKYKQFSVAIQIHSNPDYEIKNRIIIKNLYWNEGFKKFYTKNILANKDLKRINIIEQLHIADTDNKYAELITKYELELKSIHFFISLNILKDVKSDIFQKINEFIETGILIKERN